MYKDIVNILGLIITNLILYFISFFMLNIGTLVMIFLISYILIKNKLIYTNCPAKIFVYIKRTTKSGKKC